MSSARSDRFDDDFRRGERRVRVRAFVFFILCVSLSLWLVARYEAHHELERRAEATEVANAHLRLLGERLNAGLSATYALAALVRQGHGVIADFDRVAGELLGLYEGVSSLQLAPGGVIRQIVPLAGNEQALGHDLLKDPQRNKEAFLAVRSHKLTLAGPFELLQGGLGAVGRLPVFLPQPGAGEQFWGFTTVLLRFPEILLGVGLDRLPERGYEFALWRKHPDSGLPQIIMSSANRIPEHALDAGVTVPNGRWILSIAPPGGWVAASDRWWLRAGALAISALLSLALFALMVKPLALRREVARRTQALKDSEERFRTVVRTIPDLVWLKDPAGAYLGCNKRFEEAYGLATDEIVGKSDHELVAPEFADEFRASDLEAIEKGVPTASETWVQFSPDAPRRLYHTLKTPMRDARGELVGVLGISRDITERHWLSERYRASEARLKAAQSVARIGSWERDFATGEIYWSDVTFELLEFDPESVEPSYGRFLERIHRDDREHIDELYRNSRAKLAELHVGLRLQMPDGRIKHIDMRAAFEGDGSGACRRVIGTLQDVTGRHEAERKIRQQHELTAAMLAAIPVGVSVTDVAGRIIECNEAAANLLMRARGEVLGRRIAELGLTVLDGDGAPLPAALLPDAVALETGLEQREIELVLEAGARSSPVAMSAVPLRSRAAGVVLALVDLSARKQAELALRDNAERLESLNRRFAMAADAANVGVWEYDLGSGQLTWDDAMLRLNGFSPRQFDGSMEGWLAHVMPFDRERLAMAIARAQSGEHDLDAQFRVLRHGGEASFLRACARLIRTATGEPKSLTGVCLDLTTLKRSEQILIQERRRYRDLVDSTDGIVWEAEVGTGRFTYVSRRAERLLGYPTEAWYEPGFWNAQLHPEDRSRVSALWDGPGASAEAQEFEFRMAASDGSIVWMRAIVTTVAEDGVAKWMRGVMIDNTTVRNTAEALARSQEQLSLAIEGAGLGLWDWEVREGAFRLAGNALAMLGREPDQGVADFAGWQALIHPDDLLRVNMDCATHLEGRAARLICEFRLRHAYPGRWVWVQCLGQVTVRDPAGAALRAAGVLLDITERRLMEEQARAAQQQVERLSARYALILESAGEGIFGVDMRKRCMFINPAAMALLGVSELEARQQFVGELFQHRHDDGRPYHPHECPILRTLEDGVRRQVEDLIARRDGKVFAARMTVTEMREGGERIGVEVMFQDVSERRAMERELQRLATTDPLTGVTNRRKFIERCEQEWGRFKRFDDPVSLLMIDVDFFKRVNDRYGHAAGDAVLRHLCVLAGLQLRRTDAFARLGGEEFAFLLAGSELAGALEFATRFRAIVESTPAVTEAGEIPLTISIGAAQADRRDRSVDDLLSRADAALYRAKDAGRNRVEGEVADA